MNVLVTMTATDQQRYEIAVAKLSERLRADDAVLAAVVCGSLAYDRVWHKSDIDLVIVTVDDPKKVTEQGVALTEDDINVHAQVLRRESFRKAVESSRRNSFEHSYLARGRLLFTKDPALAPLFDGIDEIGDRDKRLRLIELLCFVLPCLDKAEKWLAVKHDYPYAALYVLHAATGLAGIEVTLAGKLASREVLAQARQLDPVLFGKIYVDMIGKPPEAKRIAAALGAIEAYLLARKEPLFGLVLEHVAEQGNVRAISEIDHHFARTHGIDSVLPLCEWLADHDLIVKGGTPRKICVRGTVQLQELAFGPR
jgi:predicted nucleotidyltransferase